jgi:hypothetical protein
VVGWLIADAPQLLDTPCVFAVLPAVIACIACEFARSLSTQMASLDIAQLTRVLVLRASTPHMHRFSFPRCEFSLEALRGNLRKHEHQLRSSFSNVLSRACPLTSLLVFLFGTSFCQHELWHNRNNSGDTPLLFTKVSA